MDLTGTPFNLAPATHGGGINNARCKRERAVMGLGSLSRQIEMEGGGRERREGGIIPGQSESQRGVSTLVALLKNHVPPESIAEIQHYTVERLSEL